MNNKLQYKELEELIPDYVLGRLDNKTKTKFELSMIDYPDIIVEVNSIRDTFEKFEYFDLKNNVKSGYKNFGTAINEKLYKKNIRHPYLGKIPRIVFPIMGFLVIAYFMYFTDTFESNLFSPKAEFVLFKSGDLDSLSNKNDIMSKLISDGVLNEESEISDYSLSEFEVVSTNEFIKYETESYHYQKLNINDLIVDLEEDEFINILEDLKDEKIGV